MCRATSLPREVLDAAAARRPLRVWSAVKADVLRVGRGVRQGARAVRRGASKGVSKPSLRLSRGRHEGNAWCGDEVIVNPGSHAGGDFQGLSEPFALYVTV